MTFRSMTAALAALALAAGAARAQGNADPAKVREFLERELLAQAHRVATPEGQAERTRLYEDVEILRRLMERRLVDLYGGANQRLSLNRPLGVTPNQPWNPVQLNQTGGANGWTELQFLQPYQANGAANALRNQVVQNYRNWSPEYGRLSPRGVPSGLEGTYLPGVGVIYTVTLPPPDRKPAETAPAQPEPKPLSPWEAMRREVRGEPATAAPAAKPERPASITDTLLRVLAENGQHLTQLGADERVIVAITFRPGWHPVTAATVAEQAGWLDVGAGAGLALDLGYPLSTGQGAAFTDLDGDGTLSFYLGFLGGNTTQARAQNPANPQANQPAPAPGEKQDASAAPLRGAGQEFQVQSLVTDSSIRDYLLLGDLHLKQGRVGDAVAAYAKAAELLEKAMNSDWKWDPNHLKTAHEVYPKLAQAHLAAGNVDAARKALDKQAQIPAPAQGQPAADPSRAADKARDKPAPAPLPGKLVLSVSKRLLDQVGGGKMSFEDFRKQVYREHLTFEPPAK